MRRWVIWLLLGTGLAAGCKKQEPELAGTVPGESAPTAPPSPRGPGPTSGASTNPTVISDSGDVNVTLQQMTQELRDYVVRTRSVPKDFEEFIAKSEVRFPPPPEGKKYVIKGQAVVLVKR